MPNFLRYLFDPTPGIQFKYKIVIVILFLTTFLLASVYQRYLKKKRDDRIIQKLFKSIPNHIAVLSFLGIIYIFSRLQNLPYLAMRFWMYLIIGLIIFKFAKTLYLLKKVYPLATKHHLQKLASVKYIPKPKRKK